jgi:hypothetical protein
MVLQWCNSCSTWVLYLLETWNGHFAMCGSWKFGMVYWRSRYAWPHDGRALQKRQLPVAIPESIMHMWFRHCTEYTCMFTKLGKGTLLARARGPYRGCMVRNKISYKISYNISKYVYHFPPMFTWTCLVDSRINRFSAGGCRTCL